MKRGFWIIKLKVLNVSPFPSRKSDDKKYVAVALQGTSELNGNKHLLTKDGIEQKILDRALLCSRKPSENKIIDLKVEAPFDYDECELVP